MYTDTHTYRYIYGLITVCISQRRDTTLATVLIMISAIIYAPVYTILYTYEIAKPSKSIHYQHRECT